MKKYIITFLAFLMSVYASTSMAQQREIKQAPKVVKLNREIKTGDKEKISTIDANGEQHLQSGSNNSATEVISTGNMTGTPAKTEKKAENKLTVETCTELINAMEKKAEWVKNNPEEDKKAKESGWYKQTKKEIKKLKNQLKELEKNKK